MPKRTVSPASIGAVYLGHRTGIVAHPHFDHLAAARQYRFVGRMEPERRTGGRPHLVHGQHMVEMCVRVGDGDDFELKLSYQVDDPAAKVARIDDHAFAGLLAAQDIAVDL